MSFGSISFLLFMIAVFLIYWGVPHKYRWVLLLIANISFYACFDLKYLFVLLAIIIVSYVTGLYFDKKNKGESNKKTTLSFIISIVALCMPLLIFKYLNFSIYSVTKILSLFAVQLDTYTIKLIMPVGISFYTFEAISYVCDIRKGSIEAEQNFFKYALFISFFPNITSGPIERAGSFIPQIDKEKSFDYDKAIYGLRLLLLGMLKKYVCADIMVKYIANVFDNVIGFSGIVFIIAVFMYTFQIYFDFSGYTDMARAVAMLLGYDLRENFKCPYFAESTKDFWGRWHISLSTWLRDYIYIPLGGNRKGIIRKYVNLLITFFVSGLWHGASFTFIVWGMIHGICQCIEDVFARMCKNVKMTGVAEYFMKAIKILVTFCVVAFAWMFFRANSLAECMYIIKHMFRGGSILGAFQSMGMTKLSIVKVMLAIVFVIGYDAISLKKDMLKEMNKWPLIIRWGMYVCISVLVIVIKVHEGTNASFIYFSF